MLNKESLDMNVVVSQKKTAVLKHANEKWLKNENEQKICKVTVCKPNLDLSWKLKFTLASKFEDRVHISLQVWSLGLKYTLASNLGAKVYFILQYTLATTYTYFNGKPRIVILIQNYQTEL